MRIIRENLFLVILVAVVVVGGGIMLMVFSGRGERVDKRIVLRERVKKQLAALDRKSEPVNKKILAANRKSAKAYQDKAVQLGDLHVAWNASRYPVLRLPIWRDGSLLLGKSDVKKWDQLIPLLRDQTGPQADRADQKKMAKKLWASLPQPLRDQLPKEGAQVDGRVKLKLLGALNATLKDVNFFQPSEFPYLALPEEARRILRMRAAAEAKAAAAATAEAREGLSPPQGQRLNRLVLETLYPQLIAASHVPAFPIDADQYQRHSLRYHFQQQYSETIADLLATLRPASPPTEAEILQETERWDKRLKRVIEDERRQRLREAGTETPEAGGPLRGMGEDATRVMPRERRTSAGPRKPARAPASTALNPKELGQQSMLKRKAKSGWMYASAESFDMHFEGVPEGNPADAQLWWAQVNLWVTRDIVTAIIRTNEEVLSAKPPRRRNVLNAAVKKLVAIEVVDEKEAEDDRKTKTGRTLGMGMGMMEEGELRRTTTKEPTARKTAQREVPQAPSLTARVRCDDFDVVNYSFSVIMPTRHVLRLQRNLLKLNYHTIMSVNMQQVNRDEHEVHYFGTEPIMQVDIQGQLLLLSTWTRGKWDEKARQWLVWQREAEASSAATRPAMYPAGKWVKGEPLMPVEILQRRYNSKWSGLRKVDEDRVLKRPLAAGGTVSEPGGVRRPPR